MKRQFCCHNYIRIPICIKIPILISCIGGEVFVPRIVFYKEQEWVPVLEWMTELKHQDKKAFINGIAQLNLLQEQGHKLERPSAAYLEEGIYELRWKHVHVQYRILYFFNGRDFIVLTHAIVKKGS